MALCRPCRQRRRTCDGDGSGGEKTAKKEADKTQAKRKRLMSREGMCDRMKDAKAWVKALEVAIAAS